VKELLLTSHKMSLPQAPPLVLYNFLALDLSPARSAHHLPALKQAQVPLSLPPFCAAATDAVVR
jgi:hypothetical protein